MPTIAEYFRSVTQLSAKLNGIRVKKEQLMKELNNKISELTLANSMDASREALTTYRDALLAIDAPYAGFVNDEAKQTALTALNVNELVWPTKPW